VVDKGARLLAAAGSSLVCSKGTLVYGKGPISAQATAPGDGASL
jgi:hypothetical protein